MNRYKHFFTTGVILVTCLSVGLTFYHYVTLTKHIVQRGKFFDQKIEKLQLRLQATWRINELVRDYIYISEAPTGKIQLVNELVPSEGPVLIFFFSQYSCSDCISEQIGLLKNKHVLDKVILVSDFGTNKELRYLQEKFGVKKIYRLGNSDLGRFLREHPFFCMVRKNRGYNSFLPEKSDTLTSAKFIEYSLSKNKVPLIKLIG